MTKAYKIYTGPDGHTHVLEGTVAENHLTNTTTIRFKETPAHSVYDWHTAPTTQYVITLAGTLEFETYLGKTFILRPGEILIAMDTTGSGHKWKMLGDDSWKRVYVAFTKDAEVNFVPNS